MSKALDELNAAEAAAGAAREQLTATMATLRGRLAPKALLREASDGLKAGATNLANETVATVKARPAAAAAGAAGVVAGALLLLFRREALATASELVRRGDGDDDEGLSERMVGEARG